MFITDFDFLPYPTSMLILTGISFATLLYVTYPNDINKIPNQIKSQAVSVGSSVNNIGSSIRDTANKIMTPVAVAIAQPVPANAPVAVAPAQVVPVENKGIISGITNTISSLNPFAKPTAPKEPEPIGAPKIGGSKKRRQKKSKKTKRLRKK
jgi:hypothetical protein